MAGRSGFLGGTRQGGGSDWGSENSRDQDPLAGSGFRFAETPRYDAYGTPPGFDPIWGTLGGPTAQTIDPWSDASASESQEGSTAEVEIFGSGFQVSGQINMGQFDRLSDWLNMQSGFVQVQDGRHILLGRNDPEAGRDRGTLWVRLDQIVLMAERSIPQQRAAGIQVIQKERRRVRIVTSSYSLRGCLHVHANSSMKQLLQMPEPHFLPMTDIAMNWLEDPQIAARFPFAVVNREQMITILDEPAAPGSDCRPNESEDEAQREPALRRWGAA